MNLYEELLSGIANDISDAVKKNEGIKKIASTLVEAKSFSAIQRIKEILSNDKLTDFEVVEEIVLVIESLGTDGGTRHDFG